MASSVVATANERVPIAYVCRKVGMTVPERSTGRSAKVRCPFGFTHPDRGLEAAFRVYYETNSAFCFAGCGYFSPVWLAATAWDRAPADVAAELLEATGWRPEDPRERWDAALAAGEDEGAPDRAALAGALSVYCAARVPGWEDRQFRELADPLARCLRLLDYVRTADDAWRWLRAAKDHMRREGAVR